MASGEQERKFFNIPLPSSRNEVTSEQLRKREEESKAKQANDPYWKRAIRETFNKGIDATMSFMGIPINDSTASKAGELVNAGLPFAAFGPKGIKSIFHGTQRAFERFNPAKYDKEDTLGWLTHFAENPEYANQYAMGSSKGIGYVNEHDKSMYPDLPEYFDKSYKGGDYRNISPRIIPAKPEAKNVLDLVDPHVDDLAQALPFATNKPEAVSLFKRARREPEAYRPYLKESHYPDRESIPASEIPARILGGNIRLDEAGTNAMPFDAIRYHDVSEKSWAIPEKTPIRSIFGAPLNEAAEGRISPIRMVRDDNVSTGMFPAVAEKPEPRSANDYLNWAQSSPNPKHKNMNVGQLVEEYNKSKKPKTMQDYADEAAAEYSKLYPEDAKPFKIGDTVSIPQIANGKWLTINDDLDLQNVLDAHKSGLFNIKKKQ